MSTVAPTAAPGQHPAPNQAAADAPRPARGSAHLWVPRGIGDAGVLLGLVCDRPGGHPDNCAATGRLLDLHRDTVRRLRGELLRMGLSIIVDEFLVATDAGLALMRQGSDPLPRALLRGRSERPTLAMLRACAVVYADAIGWRAERHGCRSDAERATLADVSRRLIVAARALLAERRLIEVEVLRRGRADLRRARLTSDRCATHGSPMRDERAERLAEHARRGRLRLARGAESGNSGGAETGDTPLRSPAGTVPLQAPVAPGQQGGEPAPALEGCPGGQQAEGGTVVLPATSAEQRRRRGPVAAGDVLGELVPDLHAARAAKAGREAGANGRAIAELQRLAADPRAVVRLLRMPAPRAVSQVLAAVGVLDQAPRLRDGLAVQVARVLAPVQVFTLALDVVLGSPRSIGGALRSRLRRAVAGEGELLTRCRASWPIGRFLDEIRGDRPQDSQAPPPPPSTPPAPTTRLRSEAQGASFDDLLRGMGLGDLSQRRTIA